MGSERVVVGPLGLSERPKPTRSTATERSPALVERVDDVAVEVGPRGSPCSSSTTGASAGPASTYAIRREPPSPSGTSAYLGSWSNPVSAAKRSSGVRRVLISAVCSRAGGELLSATSGREVGKRTERLHHERERPQGLRTAHVGSGSTSEVPQRERGECGLEHATTLIARCWAGVRSLHFFFSRAIGAAYAATRGVPGGQGLRPTGHEVHRREGESTTWSSWLSPCDRCVHQPAVRLGAGGSGRGCTLHRMRSSSPGRTGRVQRSSSRPGEARLATRET